MAPWAPERTNSRRCGVAASDLPTSPAIPFIRGECGACRPSLRPVRRRPVPGVLRAGHGPVEPPARALRGELEQRHWSCEVHEDVDVTARIEFLAGSGTEQPQFLDGVCS